MEKDEKIIYYIMWGVAAGALLGFLYFIATILPIH